MTNRDVAADWNDFPIVAAEEIQPDWVELEPTGWGALIAWHLGPSSVRRCVAPQRDAGFEEEIDGYLGCAGIPAHPHGYLWYAMPVDDLTAKQRLVAIGEAVRDNWPTTGHPRDISSVVEFAARPLSR